MRPDFERGPGVSTTEEVHISHQAMDAAYKRALQILQDPINPREFTDYKDVAKDLAFVERAERDFELKFTQLPPEQQRVIKLAKIIEAIIFEHGEKSNWFGESATTMQTSRYDDIVNHLDTIIQF